MDVKAPDEGTYRFGPFLLDPGARLLSRADESIALTHRLFELLLTFVRNPGRLLTKDELMEAVWPGRYIEEGSLTQAIFTLRKALNDKDSDAAYIVTAPGRGYKFAASVERIAPVMEDAPEIALLSPNVSLAAREITDGPAKRRRPFVWALAAAAVVFVGLGFFLFRQIVHEPAQTAAPNVVVAAAFENFTGESSFPSALGKVLEIDLSQSPFLRMLSEQQIGDTLALMGQHAGGSLSADLARKVCMRNGGGAVVGGSVNKLDADYLLTVTATDCVSGRVLAGEKAQARDKTALVQSLDGLASRLRAELGEAASSIQKFDVPLLSEKTASFDALVAFSRGVSLYEQGKRVDGGALFKHAIALDPNFAVAYLHLAAADYALNEDDEAAQAITRAYILRDRVNERDRLVIQARYHENVQRDLEQTISDYKLWTDMYPRDGIAWADLANEEDFVGRNSEAITAGQHAVALNPKEEAPFVILMRAYMRSGRTAAAAAVGRTIMLRHLDGDDTHRLLLEIAYLRHDARGMAEQLSWAKGKPSEQRIMLITEALLAYAQGRIDAGEALFAQSAALGSELGLHDFTAATRANLLAAFGLTKRAQTMLAQVPGHIGLGDYLLTTAEIGDEALARSILSNALMHAPTDTMLNNYSAPAVRAALDLRDARPQSALADLVPAAPYQRRGYDVPYLRGEAHLALKDGRNAVRDYRQITDNPGINPISTLHTLAFLGLARAYRLEGDVADSRRAYEALLSILASADPDLPVLSAAKTELAVLTSGQGLRQVSDRHGGG